MSREFKVGDWVQNINDDTEDVAVNGIYLAVDIEDDYVSFYDDKGDKKLREMCRYARYDPPQNTDDDIPTSSYTSHPTGALRESKEGKGKPHLVLAGFPRALMALSRHVDCELGRERNWEQGLPESSLIDSQFRHLLGYVSGVSEDTPEYNLTASLWNSIVLLEEYLRVQDGVMEDEVLDVEKGVEG
tara:strand:+ start:1804 stop:2364 length:561 start_codon:yes stop_codon:yes gene_type:complete